MPIKETCNATEAQRMRRLAAEDYTIPQIAKGMKVSVACVKRQLAGVAVAKAVQPETIEREIVGADAVEVEAPMSPQQKAAATRKANKAAAAPAADFME